MSAPSSVAAVVVSHNTRDLLRACVESLVRAREAGEVAEIVVVDSGSGDGSVEIARELLGDAAVIAVPNRGYGSAANVGMDATSASYALVLNADTLVPAGAVRTLARFLDVHPWTALAGPRLRRPDGSTQLSRRRFPTRLTPLFESTIVEEWWPSNRWARHYRMEDAPDAGAQEVDWLVGAALLARRAAFEQAGGFDPAFRMYSEEVEWCWRFRLRGWQVAWVPDAEITHYEGASTRQDVPTRQLDFDLSRVQLMQRLYGRRHAAFVRVALLAGYLIHIVREALKWVVGHRRELR
ncbi:MAG TPA: glycosyltransferase family 2 protein, partial [Thermomicrobiales bacterium]|nr:glycosyltransferase family 2 protein [Thermomicrobiales bacterium]